MAYQSLRLEYLQIPPVSRAYTTACVLTTAAVVSSCDATSSSSKLAMTGSSENGLGPRRSPVGLPQPGVGGDIRADSRVRDSPKGAKPVTREGCAPP